ncbi:nucleotidyltransferase [Patescibacteria group bacterium]|nr:nucleotidyltransferase [Patescibacteria group bacterium]
MSTSIVGAFETFKSRLNITDNQAEDVSITQRNVRKVLGDNLIVIGDFLTGSYIRDTLIPPMPEADVDIFVVLDVKHYHNYNGQNGGPGGLLDCIKRNLIKQYPKTPKISRNGQAVTITFNAYHVDVTPAFHRTGGGYFIPNSNTHSWLSTDPREHIRMSSQHNKKHNGNLIPLIKMIKCWNKNIGFHFNSFHLETLAWDIFEGISISNFSSGARYFFDKGRNKIDKKNPDPAGFSEDVGNYIDSKVKIDEAVSRFSTAYARAINAESYALKGKIHESIEEWRKIFGTRFPSYG